MNGPLAKGIRRTLVLTVAVGLFLTLICTFAAAEDVITFVVGLGADPKSLGPTSTDNDQCVSYRVFSSLITSDENNEPAPELAQSWDVSDDFTTYTFYLNPAATFHDGTPVTSEDVKFSILEVNKTLVAIALRGLIPAIESVETPDEHTVVFHLNGPYPEMLNTYYGVGPVCGFIVKKADWEGTDFFTNRNNLEPIGSGPFKFVEWVKGSHIVLERWEDYWGEKPVIERIVYRIIPDPTAMGLAFEKGEVDWVPYVLDFSLVAFLNSLAGKEATFHGTPGAPTSTVRFNLRRELFQDIAVRRAFAYAINRDRIPELVFFGGAVPASGFVMRNSFTASWQNPNAKQVPYDPEMARTLLDMAGYPVGEDGWRFHISLVTQTFVPGDLATAELLKADLAEVNIDAKLAVYEYAGWIDKTFVNWDFDLNCSPFGTGPVPSAMGRLTTSNIVPVGWANDMGFSNLEYDALYERMLIEADFDRRKADVYRMQQILVEEQPMVFLVYKSAASAWNTAKFVADPAFWKGGLGYLMMRFTNVRPTAS